LAQEHNNKQSINNKQSAILNKEKEKLIIKRKRNLNAKAFLENRKIKKEKSKSNNFLTLVLNMLKSLLLGAIKMIKKLAYDTKTRLMIFKLSIAIFIFNQKLRRSKHG
ncbi:MAG: hypothetical protein NZ601_02405, partial [candidate division WOR-3 bacterium]|nr:hypothetical protein [candidate division WOR-3 bacterium]